MDELEEIKKVGNGNIETVTQILRRDFDNDKYGQERRGNQSAKTRTVLRWNIVFSTTPETAANFFANNIENGTFSRMNLCTIVKEDVERRPKFGHYDAAFDKKLSIYLARLESAKGTIICPQAKRLAEKLLDRAEDRALMIGDDSYVHLSYRGAVIAFRKSILLYIMCGMKWSKEIEALAMWSLKYDMWCKMHFFGQQMSAQMEGEVVRTRGPQNLLDMLADTFTQEDAKQVRIRANKKPYPNQMLCMWVKRGYITQDADGIYHKTESYLKRCLVA
jgi:hypothetical protein